eukprot:Skav223011  [mRNA]  locus=scaffold1422:63331:69191:+ [translate_table: standard]
MSRALVPLAIGGAGVSLLRWHFLRWAVHTTVDTALAVVPQILQNRIEGPFDCDWWFSLYQLGGFWIAWELRYEIIGVARAFLRLIWLLLIWVLDFLWFAYSFGRGKQRAACHQLVPVATARERRERGVCLTSMAVVAAPAGGASLPAPFPIGSFVLISRPPHWDEIWIAGFMNGNMDILGRTTSSDGSDWARVVIRMVALAVKSPLEQPDGSRRPPAGIAQGDINWIYVPPNCNTLWIPDPVEVIILSQEAQLILRQLETSMSGVTVNMAVASGDLVALVVPGGAPMAPGGAGAAPGGGAGGLGMQSGGDPTPSELKALEKAVQQLQAMALTSEEDRRKSKKKKDKKSKKSDKKDKKKKRRKSKKHKKSRSSSSSTSSSRSRSRSSSSSSGSSARPLTWREKGKDKKVTYEDLTYVDQLRLKKKGDLLSFAAKNPGALTAHFLAGVYARLSKGTISRSSQLREASVSAWAHQHSGLSEPRDLKEVLTLAEVLDHVNRREIARALDIIVQRIVAIQQARQKGGSWEKAENLELVSSQRGQAPAAPPQLLHAMIVLALVLGRPQLSVAMMLAYCGLLRVREVLSLRVRDAILQGTTLILCLGRTKRGMEQKVILNNSSVVLWFSNFISRHPPTNPDDLFFSISYSSMLRWVKRLAFLLGAETLQLTTHTFRRSGASELSRQGMPLSEILLYGRWLSERAARDYIRKGEVAIWRSKGLLKDDDWNRIESWGALASRAWVIYDGAVALKVQPQHMHAVTTSNLASLEESLFNSF